LTPLSRVAGILTKAAGAGVRLGPACLLKSWERNDVWRCAVVEGPAALGAGVVVKRFKSQPERGLDEWASLEFLTRLGLTLPVAPRFLGGDLGGRFFVMEDLGPGPTLEALLHGDDADAAAEALVSLARLTGRLHAATVEHHGEFDRLREALAPRAATPRAAAAAFLRAHAGRVAAWLAAAGVPAPAGLGAALEATARAAESPHPLTAFTHGDQAPSNNHLGRARTRLLDFEYGGVRPALYDALFWTLVCPFPAPLVVRAEAAYRQALGAAGPLARDDVAYRRSQALTAAWRTVNLLQWLPPSLLAADEPWAPGLSARQAILWHLDRFGDLAPGEALLAPLADALARLGAALGARWAAERETRLVWPAFRGGWADSGDGRADQ
jgi:hypothetical protein